MKRRVGRRRGRQVCISDREGIGAAVLRYGLVMVLIWIGALKFAKYEADGVVPMIMNSPLLSWMLSVMSGPAAAMLIGIIEITLGLLIATRAFAPRISAIGSHQQ